MDFLTFLGYFLLVDVVLSLVVLGGLFLFRKRLLLSIQHRLINSLGIGVLFSRLHLVEEQIDGTDVRLGLVENTLGLEQEEYDNSVLKPKMKKAMNDVFGLNK